uniref:C2H2-type domain-containing protein n=1 Tax=Stegastes partitus TaxID=144197 RepID=A0A3B4ZF46_9TELE
MLVHAKEKPFSCTDCGKRFSWHFQIKRHKCGTRFWQYSGSEALWSLDPDQRLKLGTYKKTNAETETADSDSDFWKETRKHQLGFTYQRNKKLSESDRQSDTDKKVQCCPDVETQPKNEDSDVFSQSRCLQRNCETHENSGSHSDRTLLNSESQREPEDRDTQLTHPRQSTAEKPFSCSLCGKGFATGGCLTRHTSIHTGEKLLKLTAIKEEDSVREPEPDLHPDSDVGGVYFKSDDSVDSDFWKDTRQRQSGNDSDRNLFSSSEETNLQPESDDSTDSDFWKSHSGSNSLQHDGISDREVKDDAKRKPYSCTECSKTFHYIFHMKTHMKLHTEERPFFCSICGQKCLYKSHLKIHMRTHTGEKPFVCPICGKKYAHKASMQSHMSEHAKHYSCSVCERSFNRKLETQNGTKGHTGKNRFSCSLCGKSFSKIAGLSYHLKIHSGEKSFSCSVCRKKFRKKGHLKYHVLIHTGVKPFSCSVCHRTFRWPSQIKIHKCVQEAPQCLHNKLKKPLSCSTCGEKFSDGSLLTSHRRIHQEKKKMLSCSFF